MRGETCVFFNYWGVFVEFFPIFRLVATASQVSHFFVGERIFFWDACVLCFVNFFLNLRPPQVKFAFFLCVVKIVCFYVIVVFFHLFFCIFPTRPQVDQTPVCDSIVASRKNADSLS